MSAKETGGAAFPYALLPDIEWVPGLTIRDWFAGQALGGVIVADELARQDLKAEGLTFRDWANASYRAADAMLAERARDE